MSEFIKQKIYDKFVITDKFITEMVGNDQYNSDTLSSAPRGVLALNEHDSTLNMNQSTLTKSTNLSFDFTCDANRLIGVGFNCGAINMASGSGPENLLIRVYIDEIVIGSFISNSFTVSSQYYMSPSFDFICPTSLSAGDHSVNVYYKSFGGTNIQLIGSATNKIQIWAHDLGSYRSI